MGMGRPREFDTDIALDRALDVFWRHGYEGASLTDLTEAMGVTRPSLYAAFGNKEELFRKVVDRYNARRESEICTALDAPTSRRAMEQYLHALCDMADSDADAPRGCLMVQGALVCSEASDPVRRELTRRRADWERELCERLRTWRAMGDLPAEADVKMLARYMMTVSNGIAVQAAGGTSSAELRSVADLALQSWPQGPRGAATHGHVAGAVDPVLALTA